MLKHVLLCCLLGVASIGAPPPRATPAAAAAQETTLTESDDGRQIELGRGATLVVKLKAQFGTGYRWMVAANDGRRLQPAGESVVAGGGADGDSNGETQIFRFQARRSGRVRLVINYVRSWEKEAAPLKTFRLTIKIGKRRG